MPGSATRPTTVALLAAVSLAAAGGHGATSVTRYRLDIQSRTTIDLSAVGGEPRSSSIGLIGFLTITLSDSAGGRVMLAVLDSLLADSATEIPRETLDSVRGTSWHGLVAQTGKISDLTAVKTTIATPQLAGIVASFFPRIKPGARPGDRWTDTLDFTNAAEGNTTASRAVTNYGAVGNEKRDGQKVLRVTGAFSSSRTGTLQSPQGELQMEGTGHGSGTYYVGADGRYLGGTSLDSSTVNLTGGGAPVPIPIIAVNTLSVAVLK